jgi:hypothetical protein
MVPFFGDRKHSISGLRHAGFHPSPHPSTRIPKGLADVIPKSIPETLGLPDSGDVGDYLRSQRFLFSPPGLFYFLLQTKVLREINPWTALARRLGDASKFSEDKDYYLASFGAVWQINSGVT